jgi:predicted RNase H-like HicB family nuclease
MTCLSIPPGRAASSFRVTARFHPAWPAPSRAKPDGNEEILMARYVALVDGKPGAFGVVVPDLPGCTSGGATVDDALRNAVEAVTLWVEDARADGEKIPKPRSAEALRDDAEVAAALAHGGILAYVPLMLDSGRPVKANLSLDAGLLEAIDEAAERRGLTRSAFLASAAREKIESEG